MHYITNDKGKYYLQCKPQLYTITMNIIYGQLRS